MPIVINQVKSGLSTANAEIIHSALKKADISEKEVATAEIYKTSLDARKHSNIHFIHSVYIELKDKSKESFYSGKKDCQQIENAVLKVKISKNKTDGKVVIAGFGPAGMFCGLILAEYGYKPIILERGQEVGERIKTVEKFWNGGEFDEKSNVQFGEGGAGTFSDGKLTTRIKDPLCRYVLERFTDFGAPKDILSKAKPHIGTDNLRGVVKNIRQHIIKLGGKVCFSSRLEDFQVDNNSIINVTASGEKIKSCALVMAVGHSARDTFEMLAEKGVFLEPKPFSIGVRIEHTQQEVDCSLYGKHAGNPLLPKGEYQLSHRDKNGRAVYTFCMCPGGMVVPSSSEKGGVVTNGMSEYARNGKNANAAIAVSVSPEDFGKNILGGVEFARNIEKLAYKYGGQNYSAPATTVRGFLQGKPDLKTNIIPTYARGLKECEFRNIFPKYLTDMLEMGLYEFSKKMRCFDNKNAVMTAPETRTSSPVRITRTENLNSLSIKNLYPCGEGAGYAGGIVSAAVDGIKVALKIMETFSAEE